MNPTNGNMNRNGYSNGYTENYSRVNNYGNAPVRAVPKREVYEEHSYSGYGGTRSAPGQQGNYDRDRNTPMREQPHQQPSGRYEQQYRYDDRIDPYAYSGDMNSPGCYQYSRNQYADSNYGNNRKKGRTNILSSLGKTFGGTKNRNNTAGGMNAGSATKNRSETIGISLSVLVISTLLMAWVQFGGLGTSALNTLMLANKMGIGGMDLFYPLIATAAGAVSLATYFIPNYNKPQLRIVLGIAIMIVCAIALFNTLQSHSMFIPESPGIGLLLCGACGTFLTVNSFIEKI